VTFQEDVEVEVDGLIDLVLPDGSIDEAVDDLLVFDVVPENHPRSSSEPLQVFFLWTLESAGSAAVEAVAAVDNEQLALSKI